MATNGSINVSALFHDTDGTTAINVVSLQSSNAYTTGKVAIITGTAGTALTNIVLYSAYENAAGEAVTINQIQRVLYSWSNQGIRNLELVDVDNFAFRLHSRSGEVAAGSVQSIVSARLTASSQNTGTYTIIIYGT
ncbi:MAG: hypothetical protein FJ284_03490 [Planctomycetes bacterium]|nr:hypothetical protein [Planctomycetota bacterium]